MLKGSTPNKIAIDYNTIVSIEQIPQFFDDEKQELIYY
jgi:hypothetical protein